MIPNTRPELVANFRHDNPHGEGYTWTNLPILAWDADGEPLVINPLGGQKRLRRATDMPGFTGITESDETFIAAVPGQGWRAEFDAEDGTTHIAPVVAFMVDRNGWGKPVTASETYIEPETSSNFTRLIPPTQED